MIDPWAWLHADTEEAVTDLRMHRVSAVVLADVAEELRPLLAEQSLPPAELVICDNLAAGVAEATGEWLWLLPRVVAPAPDALERLVRSGIESEQVALVGPLMLRSQRRARAGRIESCGLTVTPAGRMVPAVEGGELDQGQLSTMSVLGVDLSAALVRRDAWAKLDGALTELPDALAGVELGRRANALGFTVVAEPAARVSRAAPGQADPVEQRAWELRMAAAGRSAWTGSRLLIGSLLAALGFLLGKDAGRAAAELRALAAWLGDPPAAAVLRSRAVRGVTFPGLTPTRRRLAGQFVDRAAGRLAEAWADLADAGTETSLDELTGDDFADRSRLRRLSPLSAGAYLVGILALIAGWRLLGVGRLTGAGLLPSPEAWTDLLHAWLDPVAGHPNLTGPPWLGSTALAALVTFGQVEWLVTGGFLIAVPLAWILALRLLRHVGVEGPAAVIGALGYGIAPVIVGALGGGWLGVLTWAVLLPLLAHALAAWVAEGSWRAAGAIGLWLAFAIVEVPLTWALVLLAMAVAPALRSWRGVGQAGLVAASGLVGLGPTVVAWWSFPGRFLTGASPTLATEELSQGWELLLAHPSGIGVAPLWVCAAVAGTAWVAALLGLYRRPRAAAPGFVAAILGLGLALGLSRLVVTVPPGTQARPQVLPWLVLMLGGLTLAAGRGLAGLTAGLRRRTLGGWHAAVLALAAVVVAAVGVGAGWWAWAGTATLQRTTSEVLPPFVRVAMTSPAPVRTLAIARESGGVRWALLEGDLPRLGEDERSLAGSVEPQRGLAASVVNRLLSGSADDQLSADLARLGVGYLWLQGGDAGLRTAIGNVPGLGVGTGDEGGATWPVPNAARATIVAAEIAATGDGATIPAGIESRELVLAEPADPRWWATVDGRPLAPRTLPDGRQAFALGSGGGVLRFGLRGASPLWAWSQLAGVVLLAILASPRVRRRQ